MTAKRPRRKPRLCVVTSDDPITTPPQLPKNLRMSYQILGVTIWWMGFAVDEKDAIRKCRKNWRENYPLTTQAAEG